ncbi:hypothetical protein HNP38_002775 [Chryseobacterium defluvii]|uniref:Uncharacterized protein n=1 Tax=Chryseobacterium defluvii TaxID=160396 RepID=A0A840KD86_9FLAO|nr:hypothetical protein [Chryseobacterium defluvii]MBB4807469.1 hypothetical protein [Chryseobacterium defluvii]
MRININFLQTGGVPLTNDLMATIMDAILTYNVLGDLAGNLTIISGCTITGQNVSPGVVIIDGDVLYFEGGTIVSTVYVHTEEFTKTFQDTTDKVLIIKKTVKFGSGATNHNWDDFIRLSTLKELQIELDGKADQTQVDNHEDRLIVLEKKTAPIINGGIVWAWFKPVAEIPAGWKECTNVRGKTIVGWNPNDNDFSTIGNSGGSKTVQLTVGQLPKIKFQYTRTLPWAAGSSGGFGGGGNQFNISTQDTNELGNNTPINIMIPHTIAAFIEPNF